MIWVRRKNPSRVRPVADRLGYWREGLSLQAHLAWCELGLALADPARAAVPAAAGRQSPRLLAGRFPRNSFAAGQLAGVIMAPKFQSADIPVAQHLIYLNLLPLLVLPLALAHWPFADRRRRVGRSITGSFLVCLLLLAVVLPSPIHTFDQLVVWSRGDRVSCRQGASSDWRPLSRREIVGPLPLLKPGTWTRQP